MEHPIAIHHLTPADWQRLDAELDALLALAADQRRDRLEQLRQHRPDDVVLLESLLDGEADSTRLDQHLKSALSFLAEQEALPQGTRIGAWQLVRPIGSGGMAEVFLAERADGAFQRQVALKLLRVGLVSENAELRVRQERQILADLADPRIAGLVDGGMTEDGRPWLAMEFVQGQPITTAWRDGRLNLQARIRLLIEVCEAVASAHRQFIVHGDIKPSNVLVTAAGEVKLLDFGIARLIDQRLETGDETVAQWNALTPSVASPEQRAGASMTPSSDVYQLGLLLRELSFEPGSIGQHRARELKAITDRALNPEPKKRYSGADRLAEDLAAFLENRPIEALEGGTLYRIRCFSYRNWPALSLTAVVLTIGLLALIHQLNQAHLLAERNASNEAVLAYLEDMLQLDNPKRSSESLVADGGLLEEAATELDQRLAEQPQARVRVLNTLGRIHQARNEIVIAGRRHAAALDLARENNFPTGIEDALDGLAVVGSWAGDYARSEIYLRELLELRQNGRRPRAMLDRTRLQLADLLHSRGKYAAALSIARSTQDGSTDPAWSMRVLGMIQRDLGQFETAEASFESSYAFETESQPLNAPRLAELSDHRAVLALHRGRYDEARAALDESTRQRQRFLGDTWEGLIWTRHWNALYALAEGEIDEAARLLDIMLPDYQEFLGESSHLLAFGRSDRAWTALALGDTESARRLFDLAAIRLISMQTGDHPRLAEVRLGQAMVALAEGELATARTMSEQALAIRRALPGDGGGLINWRDNACRLVRLTGGACTEASGRRLESLDIARLMQAQQGLCRNPTGLFAEDKFCSPLN